jgi:EAL domain-containing protein (putative c-di-GMP-specific phosphodiesterase class I)/GGDEF domain-containing protein/CBS domain-containing protein
LKEVQLSKAPEYPSELHKQLSKVIENSDIKIVFQPIVSLRDGSVLGYEALSRGPVNTPLQNPDALFGVAMECGLLWDLELLCRTKALESAYESGADIKLFLNVNPYVIHDEKFKNGFTKEYLKNFNIDPENIFFEITEKSAIDDLDGFKKTIEHYKRQNYKIAIDDAGAGYSGLNMITDVHPHYIKLDINLIRDIDKDGYKKTLVKSLYEFSRFANISLIAEGIETESELEALIDIGVHYGQGFFIQRPDQKIKEIGSGVLESIKNRNSKRNNIYYHFLSSVYIGNLCRNNVTVSPSDTAENVYNIFLSDDSLLGVTVVNRGIVVGLVTKTRIDHIMSGQFGFSLHAKRPISIIMDTNPLVTDYPIPIDTVTKLAMSRPAGNLYDFIVVTQDSKYCGIVTIKDLLEKTMEIEVSNARQQNPLSGLPGNLLIEHSLAKCLASADPFTVLYLDIDNFKAFNDVYGFENGDSVIRFVACLLNDIIPQGDFIGHVGGDDFIAILPGYEAEPVCRALIDAFDKGVKIFYTPRDLQKGYVIAKNRRGEDDQFPIMSISIAGVTNREQSFQNIYELSEQASIIKKKCKLIWESCFYIDCGTT